MKDINLMSLDLELNQPSGTIIQVGAVVGNLKSGEILEEYLCHIKTTEEISEYITKLTGIRQEDVNQGYSLQLAYEQLISLYERNGCSNRGCTLTWGGGDVDSVRQTLGLKNYNVKPTEDTFYFGRRWLDVKTVFISYQWAKGLKHQAGLAKALLRLGLNFKGRKHNARDDARNTFLIFRELIRRFENGE
jgi:inhibitor of KinA sporulation pathway (predicted exonuclease)